jgi:hypothetical protein
VISIPVMTFTSAELLQNAFDSSATTVMLELFVSPDARDEVWASDVSDNRVGITEIDLRTRFLNLSIRHWI